MFWGIKLWRIGNELPNPPVFSRQSFVLYGTLYDFQLAFCTSLYKAIKHTYTIAKQKQPRGC